MDSNGNCREIAAGADGCSRSCVLCRVPQGAIRYCEACERYGVEFGTFFVSVNGRQLCRLLELSRHLRARLREEPSRRRVGLTVGRPSVALLLDPDQLESFHGLLARAVAEARRAVEVPLDFDVLGSVN